MKNILMVIKTNGLEYDDRLRKEVNTLKQYHNVEIVCLLSENKYSKGKTDYGVNYTSVELTSRKILPSSSLLLIKLIEFYYKVHKHSKLDNYDYLWLHGEPSVPFLFSKYSEKIIWDLHEHPSKKINNKLVKYIVKKVALKIHHVFTANKFRKELLDSTHIFPNNIPISYLNNYPDRKFKDLPTSYLSDEILEKLNGEDYFLLQGGGRSDRYPIQAIKAIKKTTNKKIIIVGPIRKKVKKEIDKNYAKDVILTGFVDQMDMVKYIDHCWASIIFYTTEKINTRYCSPNRIYQAISRRIPVLVGNNEPMKNLVNEYKIGVSVESDGRKVEHICNGIINLENNYPEIIENLKKHHDKFLWENQEYKILDLFK